MFKPALAIFAVCLLPASWACAGSPFKPQAAGESAQVSVDGYFSCEAPKKWKLERKKDQRRMGVFKIELISPYQEKTPTTIYMSYFAADNKYFKDAADYIESNSQDEMAAPGDVYGPVKAVVVAGRKGSAFDREEKRFLRPDSKSGESARVKEKFYVLPAKAGFYVMHFSAVKEAFARHLPVFEKAAASFSGRP